MKITLEQSEITTSVMNYVKSLISVPADKTININFQTTRSPFSIYAEIDITDKASETVVDRTFQATPIVEDEKAEVPFEATSEPQNVHSLFGSLK